MVPQTSSGASACVSNASRLAEENVEIELTLFVIQKKGARIQLRFNVTIVQSAIHTPMVSLFVLRKKIPKRIKISNTMNDAWRKRLTATQANNHVNIHFLIESVVSKMRK